MSPASVTLASVLHIRGEALSEEEIWSLLSLAAERLLEDLRDDSSDYVVCPWSALLSAAGSLSFQDKISHLEATPFKAPELLLEQKDGERPDASQAHVYSLGMTLYWSAGFRVPPHQPLQLGEPLHCILLTMCEDRPHRRLPLLSVLETCRLHRQEVALYPASANLHVKRLVDLVLGTISEVERRVVEESSVVQQDRSSLLRNRLHQASCESPASSALECLHPCGAVWLVSERSTETQSSLEPGLSTSAHSRYSLSASRTLPAEVPRDLQESRRLSSGSGSPLSVAAENSLPATPSQRVFVKRKGKIYDKNDDSPRRILLSDLLCEHLEPFENIRLSLMPPKFSRPEFLQLAREAPVTLHLPGSIVTKKGKSYLALRDLCVVLLSGQCLEVKCDIMSTVGAIFNAVATFANLGEITYFGLAYMKGKEFFFLNNDTKLCKIAPDGWSEQPQKKTSCSAFTLFLRIKFFVSHCQLLQQSQTRHQFYLQLRKDILEENLFCSDETLLQLGVLALQAEFGSYPEEQADSGVYFRVEDYIPASLIERMTVLRAQVQVSEMHRLSPVLWGEAAELEFLRITQQLPEYGVLVHRVLPEKTRPDGEMALGMCAKGVIVYEMKNDSRIAILRFQWREIGKISTFRKKFTITSSVTGRKHMFVTDSTKTCKYLLGLCSAQHHFNALMSSPQVVTDYDKCVQMANLNLIQLAQSKPLTWMQKLSCTDNALFESRLEDTEVGLQGTSLDNFSVEANKESSAERMAGSPCTGREQRENSSLNHKTKLCDPVSESPVHSVYLGTCQTMDQVSGLQNNRGMCFASQPDQEIVHVTLSRDPCRGFGFVINEGEDTDKVYPGIFISSIIPGGPAEKSKKIKSGGQILSLNHISLEGFTFNMAVRMIQNSPDSIELIISQSKGVCGNTPSKEKKSIANSGVLSTSHLSNGQQGGFSSSTQDQKKNNEELEMAEIQSLMPGQRSQLSSLLLKHGAATCPPLLSETNANEIYFVELAREDGTLGFSVTGGVNTSVLYGGIYVKSIVPGGPAAREGQIVQGDRLLQVDGVNLYGLTHKQAVQCLKGSGQVARLVLERRVPRTTQQCPSANDRLGDECTTVSLATALPGRTVSGASATDGLKFEVKLKKNASGLGFSFVQMESENCSNPKNHIVRIKRLFPGQPAEENGAIAVGDIILAVNGRSTEGLVFQEVLHLLRGASEEVTLLLCRPLQGALPGMDQGQQTPAFSADKEFFKTTCIDSGQSPNVDPEDCQGDKVSLDTGKDTSLSSESSQKATREVQKDQDIMRPWVASLMHPQDPHPHLCRLHQEMDALALATSLERDLRQNCYSVCDLRRLESPELDRDDEKGDICYPPEVPSSRKKGEKPFTIYSSLQDQLPCGNCLEADSETIPLPQFCSWHAPSESLPQEESYDNENEWEDPEEAL